MNPTDRCPHGDAPGRNRRARVARRVSVRRTVQSLAGRPVEFDVETRTGRRCVDLDPATMTELDRWRRRRRSVATLVAASSR
jgi:hypothetical protein